MPDPSELLTVEFGLNPPELVPAPGGQLMYVTVNGGVFRGPYVSGTVVSGHDRARILSPDSFDLDVYAHLVTVTSVSMIMTMRGVARRNSQGQVRARTSVRFHTSQDGPLGWLNGTAAIAEGYSAPETMTYRVRMLADEAGDDGELM